MFDKILIANRGEIACRIIKTIKKMGIKSVAVFSDADRDSLHVSMADEAIYIGDSQSTKSYLNISTIINACRKTSANAVHPGYGFLSENEVFQKSLENNGISFIGPSSKAIQIMGDKIESKNLANKIGVPIIPGFAGVIKDSEHAISVAKDIGYPVMIKASAGGGGKGMRVAHNNEEVLEGFTRAQSEARSSFGDDRIFIEKFVENPRHIEIQILADNHGNCLYLGERECSIQRRHQKIIEEAPSPFLDKETRIAMGKKAILLAESVNYVSAGTVEFIVDDNKNFYFLEMNTRLQVEHPVTELITGVDIVEWMIRIAAGDNLTFKQNDIKLNGHAIESRIYAEDPYRNFLPSTGRLTSYILPEENQNIRVDTGVREGGEISIFYDPMIAKLCSWSKSRKESIDIMRNALDNYRIKGVRHNMSFLSNVMRNNSFVKGQATTKFVEEEYPLGLEKEVPYSDSMNIIIYSLSVIHDFSVYRASLLSLSQKDYNKSSSSSWIVIVNDKHFRANILSCSYDMTANNDSYSLSARITINKNKEIEFSGKWFAASSFLKIEIDGQEKCLQIEKNGSKYALMYDGYQVEANVLSSRNAELIELMPKKQAEDLSNLLLSPMPGLLVSVEVSEGQKVKSGESLAVIEAMKMENILRAERDVTIKKVLEKKNSSLSVDQVIMEFE